ESALDRAAGFQQQARWAEARAVLGQARGRLGEAGPEDLRARLGRAEADLDGVGRVDAIRLSKAPPGEGKFDPRSADRDYAEVFGALGLKPGVAPEAAAATLRSSAVRTQLVAALDDWATVAADVRRRDWVLAVARGTDPDRWRNQVRD